MRRLVPSILGVTLAVFSGNVQADWPTAKHKSGIDAARNNSWPQPFRAADANAVIAPFEVMRNNGWREHNTVCSAHFSADNRLSDAGALKIQWILTQNPVNQRVVYVKSGFTSEDTDARVESVQLAVSKMVPVGPLPQILLTDIEPSTSSGVYQKTIHQALLRTTPTPRLGKFSGLNAPSSQSVAPGAGDSGSSSGGGGNK